MQVYSSFNRHIEEVDTPSSDITLEKRDLEPIFYGINDLKLNSSFINSVQTGRPGPPIDSLRGWQMDLFSSRDWINEKNFVISVPTACGKTLAAEVAISQCLYRIPSSKIIYCVPFVSLAMEKFDDFSLRFEGFLVRPYYQHIGGNDFVRGSIAVCTYEKVHMILNHAIANGYDELIQLLIVDEVQNVDDKNRGAVVESIIAKAKMLKKEPRIICLSASVSEADSKLISKWINGSLFSSTKRNVSLKQYTLDTTGSLLYLSNGEPINTGRFYNSISSDVQRILPLISDALCKRNDNSILFFVNSRSESVSRAQFIANNIYDPLIQKHYPIKDIDNQTRIMRNKLFLSLTSISNGDHITEDMIMKGIAYHHAGLLLDERKNIETAFRNRVLRVLVSTTTLSAGVNIPGVSHVIIGSIYRFNYPYQKLLLSSSHYIQMAGRAGRKDKIDGNVIILQKSKDPKEMIDILELSKKKAGSISGHLLDEQFFDKYFLQFLCFHSSHCKDLNLFPKSSFSGFSRSISDKESIEFVSMSLNRLKEVGLCDSNNTVTLLGKAISHANIGIQEGIMTYTLLKNAHESKRQISNLELIFISIYSNFDIGTPDYGQTIWETIYLNNKAEIEAFLPSYPLIFELKNIEHVKFGGKKLNNNDDSILNRVYFSLILNDLINETPIGKLSKLYGIPRGQIESMQLDSCAYSSQIMKFAEILEFGDIVSLLIQLRKVLFHQVRPELLSLMRLPSMKREQARQLFNAGIKRPEDIVDKPYSYVQDILKNEDISELIKEAETLIQVPVYLSIVQNE